MSLSVPELRQAVSRIASTANKRLKRLDESKVFSSAIEEAGDSKFSTRGKDYNALLSEYMRTRAFLKNPTSTVAGAVTVENSLYKTAQDVYGLNMSREKFRQMVQEYYKLSSYDNEYQAQKLRYGFLYKEELEEQDKQEPIKELSRRLTGLMERYFSPGGMGYDGTSQFIDL